VRSLEDEATLVAATLVLSYALAESAALDKLGLESRRVSGIEDWGARLLEAAAKTWSDVEGGLAGIAEVGVMRNLVSHGANEVDAKSHARLAKAGSTSHALGSEVVLDYDRVTLYRARLRSLLVAGGLGRPGA